MKVWTKRFWPSNIVLKWGVRGTFSYLHLYQLTRLCTYIVTGKYMCTWLCVILTVPHEFLEVTPFSCLIFLETQFQLLNHTSTAWLQTWQKGLTCRQDLMVCRVFMLLVECVPWCVEDIWVNKSVVYACMFIDAVATQHHRAATSYNITFYLRESSFSN